MFNVNSFLTSMNLDGARPNLFEVIFADLGDVFRFRARATALPSSTIGVAPINYFGRQVKLGGNRVFGDWQITVMLDEPDFVNGPRAILEQWSARINSHVGNLRTDVNPLSYMRDATVIQYGKTGNQIAEYKMIQCFPVDISPIGLDWAADNRIAEFNVTFAMQYWTSLATSA